MAFKFTAEGVEFIIIATEKRQDGYYDLVKNNTNGKTTWMKSNDLKKFGR